MPPETHEEEWLIDTAGRLFGSPDGKAVLDYLQRQRGFSLYSSDPIRMAYNIGQFELYDYLRGFVREN